MKHKPTSKRSFDADAVAQALAVAEDRAADKSSPYDPNDATAVASFWKDAIATPGDGVEATVKTIRRRGPQKEPRKVPTTIRFDADVLAGLKATGKGWQTRVNEAMRDWLKSHQ